MAKKLLARPDWIMKVPSDLLEQRVEELIREQNRLRYDLDNLVKPELGPFLSLFSAYISGVGSAGNVTGDGTVYPVIFDAEVFDRNSDYNTANGVFTAPVTARYLLIANVRCQNIGAAHIGGDIRIVTSNRVYYSDYCNPAAMAYSGSLHFKIVTIADMDATDTAYCAMHITGGAKIVGVYGSGNPYSFFQGYLLP